MTLGVYFHYVLIKEIEIEHSYVKIRLQEVRKVKTQIGLHIEAY